MLLEETRLPGVLLVTPRAFGDQRGWFMETFQSERYAAAGIGPFVQDNLSYSTRGVLRGLHAQSPHSQGKLVYVLQGEVFDVAVDIRSGSPSFGQWTGTRLSDTNRRQMWIPAGFAHGFCVLSPTALFAYKCTEFYHREAEFSIRWDDPDIGIDWPRISAQLSAKDESAPRLADFAPSRLPAYSN